MPCRKRTRLTVNLSPFLGIIHHLSVWFWESLPSPGFKTEYSCEWNFMQTLTCQLLSTVLIFKFGLYESAFLWSKTFAESKLISLIKEIWKTKVLFLDQRHLENQSFLFLWSKIFGKQRLFSLIKNVWTIKNPFLWSKRVDYQYSFLWSKQLQTTAKVVFSLIKEVWCIKALRRNFLRSNCVNDF